MNFEVHITCKACKERLELASPPEHHQGHLHFRCRCMPPDGLLCVLMRPSLAPVAKG